MSNFGLDNNSGGNRGSFRRGSDRPELHDAVCDECGKDCRVPFRPSGNKPIFCSECFEKKGGGRKDGRSNRGGYKPRFNDRGSNRSSQRGSSGPDFSQLTKNLETLNNKLDKIIDLLGNEAKKKTSPKVVKAKKEKKVAIKKTKDSKPKVKKVSKKSSVELK